MTTTDDFLSWFNDGVERGWISEPVCATHDGLPTTTDEDSEFEQGFDPCVHAVRVWGTEHD